MYLSIKANHISLCSSKTTFIKLSSSFDLISGSYIDIGVVEGICCYVPISKSLLVASDLLGA